MKPRCYLVVANAPEYLKLREANALFNEYIGDKKRGHCVYHDHFVDRPGGVAFFAIENEEQKEHLEHDLNGNWRSIHSLSRGLQLVLYISWTIPVPIMRVFH
jgi:hypothetical protein